MKVSCNIVGVGATPQCLRRPASENFPQTSRIANILKFTFLFIIIQLLLRGRGPSQSCHSFACKQAKRDIFASQKVGFLSPASLRNFHAVEIRYLPWNTANILSLGLGGFKKTETTSTDFPQTNRQCTNDVRTELYDCSLKLKLFSIPFFDPYKSRKRRINLSRALCLRAK